MKNYQVKPVEHYVEKHGEVKGRLIWQRETKKAEKYNSQPFRRLTKEWFEWRYGKEEGLQRYNLHVEKSRQSLENFIKRHGEEKGTKVYQECMAKKNTRTTESIMRTNPGISETEAEELLRQIREKSSRSQKRAWAALDKKSVEKRVTKTRETKIARYGTESNKAILSQRYGANSKEVESYVKSLFPTVPGESSAPALKVIESIKSRIQRKDAVFEYGDRAAGLTEHRVWDDRTERGYMFDLTVSIKGCIVVILEYDGAGFHPTKEQTQQDPSAKLASGKSRSFQYEVDQRKEQIARRIAKKFYRIRSDDSTQKQQDIITQIAEFINHHV